jgi:hypothetical protein
MPPTPADPLRRALPLVAAAFLSLAAAPADAQGVTARGDSAFTWSGRVPAGARLKIHAAHGAIEATAASGETAEVRAVKRGRGDFDEVAFRTVRDGNDVIICVVRDEDDACGPEGVERGGRRWGRDTPRTDFTVRLPRGVHLEANSGNGDVRVTGATADVDAHTGNGEVHVGAGANEVDATTGNGEVEVEEARGPVEARSGNGDVRVRTAAGPVSATTGNGSVIARMSSIRGEGDMEFRTGNGEVRVEVPEGFTAVIDASMGHGRFSSDFPITLEGRFSPQRLRGTIGSGGRRVRLSSGNGDIEIVKVAR